MPTISAFYGILIQMFWNDHAPPHFHVKYGDHKAVIDIHKGELIQGNLPRRALNLVLDRTELRRTEILEDWHLMEQMQQPKPIAPLE